jgi:uncharacterized protein (DUF2384 family)
MANRGSRAGRALRSSAAKKTNRAGSSIAGRALSTAAQNGSWELTAKAPAMRQLDEKTTAFLQGEGTDRVLFVALDRLADRGADLEIANRADVVAKALGSRAKLANLLKVSASQPTRWIKGQETPNSENTRAIVDLEHVVIRARLLWGDDEVVNAWLTGRNGFLDGARPIDVIATQGSGPAIDALDQATAGAFA